MFRVFSKNVEVDGELVHRIGGFRKIEYFLQKQRMVGNFHLYKTKHQSRRLKHIQEST